ncbi:MAG: DUF5996 family protein [Bauldia litoralis]
MVETDTATWEPWPELTYEAWRDTSETLHLWTQIVGKIRLACEAWLNHSWHVTLYVTARGLSTSAIGHGNRIFEIEFDFVDHQLNVRAAEGARRQIPLEPRSVSAFYKAVMGALDDLGLPVRIDDLPNEVVDAIPFSQDVGHAAYDPDYANRFWRVLLQTDRILKKFRTGFVGKSSPVHFFWGSFDIAVTRFTGRSAPVHPGGVPNLSDAVTREAYSHEVSSAGFWPGAGLGYPAFYSYAYPVPDGFSDASVSPAEATWNAGLGQFLLPYEVVRTARDPDRSLLSFLQSTFDAAAGSGGWNIDDLVCPIGRPRIPRAYE